MAYTIKEEILKTEIEFIEKLKEKIVKVLDNEMDICNILIEREQEKIHYDDNRD